MSTKIRCDKIESRDGKQCILDAGHYVNHVFGAKELISMNQCNYMSSIDNEQCSLQFGHKSDHHFPMQGKEKVTIHSVETIFAGGASSSACSSFRLIPFIAIKELADRCQLGLDRKGDKAWNATNPNADKILDDTAWVINRAEHAIKHAYLAIGKLSGIIPDDGDNDAAAIMWAGMLLIAAADRRKRVKEATQTATQKQDS